MTVASAAYGPFKGMRAPLGRYRMVCWLLLVITPMVGEDQG